MERSARPDEGQLPAQDDRVIVEQGDLRAVARGAQDQVADAG